MAARLLTRLALLVAASATTGCGDKTVDACADIKFTPYMEAVTHRLAINRPIHARIHNTGVEARQVTIVTRDAVGNRQLEGPFHIDANSVADHGIGAVTLDAGRSILELKARGFDFAIERCE